MSEISTIKLSRKTKGRLDNLKEHARETYEDIIVKMLETLNLCRTNPEQARVRLVVLDQQRRQRGLPRARA